MLNSEKMSKSTGNFRTLRQAIQEFSADATRFSLADAGDGMDDANFVFETANAAILRLTKDISWMQEVLASESSFRTGPTSAFADKVFANEINFAVKMAGKNYSEYMFREALKIGFHDLQAARNEHRLSCGSEGMNCDLLWRFMDVQTRLIVPICPHCAEYVWKELLKKDGFVIRAGWPEADVPDLTLKKANKYLQDTITSTRKLLHKQIPKSEVKLNGGLIFVNEHYDGWRKECLLILQQKYKSESGTFATDEEIISELQQRDGTGLGGDRKQIQKICMPFVRFKKDEVKAVGVQALDLRLPFGEFEVLQTNSDIIKKQLGLEFLEIVSTADQEGTAPYNHLLRRNPPSPGNPTSIFVLVT